MIVFSTTEMKVSKHSSLLWTPRPIHPGLFGITQELIIVTAVLASTAQTLQFSVIGVYCMTYGDSNGYTFLGKATYCTHQKPTDHLDFESTFLFWCSRSESLLHH